MVRATAGPGLAVVNKSVSMSEFPAEWLEAARVSKAWPFEEARKLVERAQAARASIDEVLFETGYGPSGLPHIGTFGEVARTAMVRHAFRVLTDDAIPTRLLCFSDDMDGLAESSRQRAEPGDAKTLSRQAADRGAGPLHRQVPVLRRRQQCAASRFPRSLRLRIRVHERDGDLSLRPLRRDAPENARRLRRGEGDHPADARAGAPRHLFAVPADLAHAPASCCRCRRSRATSKAGTITYIDPDTRRGGDDAGHRRAREVPVEGGLGAPLGGARRRLRDVRQGPDRFRHARVEDLQGARRHAARRLQLRALPRREAARRFRSRRATASPSRSG